MKILNYYIYRLTDPKTNTTHDTKVLNPSQARNLNEDLKTKGSDKRWRRNE